MRRVVLPVLGAGLCFGIGWTLSTPEESIKLSFLAVGQGDCAVLQQGGNAILVDTGPSEYAARLRVLPELRRLGVTKIDTIFLTHPDADHIDGTGAILRAFPGTRLAISEAFQGHSELRAKLLEWRAQPIWLSKLAVAKFADCEMTTFNSAGAANDNDASLFLKIRCGKGSAVLSGDASAETETIAAASNDWSSQILKAGHHGSRTSTSFAWLKEVRPEYVVVSCGRDNRYGHPHPDVLSRIGDSASVLRTDTHGTVSFTIHDGKFVPEQ